MTKPDTGPNRFKGKDLSARQMKQIVELGSAPGPKSYMFSEEELAEFCETLLAEQREICDKEASRTEGSGIMRLSIDQNVILNAPEPEL